MLLIREKLDSTESGTRSIGIVISVALPADLYWADLEVVDGEGVIKDYDGICDSIRIKPKHWKLIAKRIRRFVNKHGSYYSKSKRNIIDGFRYHGKLFFGSDTTYISFDNKNSRKINKIIRQLNKHTLWDSCKFPIFR